MKENKFLNKKVEASKPGDADKSQEGLDVKIEMATEKDWQEVKDLRLESILGESAQFLAPPPDMLKAELEKRDQEWQSELTPREDMFTVLARIGNEAVGIGRAIKEKDEKDAWRIRWMYVKPKFRNKGIQKKVIDARIKEIKKRGGKKAIAIISNPISIQNAKSSGFKLSILEKIKGKKHGFYRLEKDLTEPEK